MADKAGATARRAPGGSAAPNQRLTQLHVAYGNALIAARGFGAPETTEAFARARESASGDKDAPERLAADYGLWVGSLRAWRVALDAGARRGLPRRRRGETRFARGRRRSSRDGNHALVRRRVSSRRAIIWNARSTLFQPGRDDDLAFRFGQDAGVAAMLFLALASWPMGDIDRAVSLVGDAEARIADLAHVSTRAYGKCSRGLVRTDARRPLARRAERRRTRSTRAQDHDLPMWRAHGRFSRGFGDGCKRRAWRRAGGHASRRRTSARAERPDLRRAIEDCARPKPKPERATVDRAVAILDEALATSERTGPSRVRSRTASRRAAKFCSSAIPPTPRPRKKPS